MRYVARFELFRKNEQLAKFARFLINSEIPNYSDDSVVVWSS